MFHERTRPTSLLLSLYRGGFSFLDVCFFFFEPRANFFRFCFSVSHQHFTQKFTRHIIITHTGITLIITVASENHGRCHHTHTRLTLTQSHAIHHPAIHPGWREREGKKKEDSADWLLIWSFFFLPLSLSRHPGLVTNGPLLFAFPYV